MLRKLLFVMLVIMSASMVTQLFADYLVNFEGASETKTSYASGTVNLSGLDWNMTDALIGTDVADWKIGVRSARMRGYGTSAFTMIQDKANGVGVLSFQYRRYGTDAQVDWKVEVSYDSGSNWTQVGMTFTSPASDDVQTFSETVNQTGNVRIRVKRATETGTSNRRLNIDAISITDYAGGTPTPIISVSGTLNPFSTYTGTPSTAQTYTLSGSNLTTNIAVTAPAGYQVSSNGADYSNTLSLSSTYNGLVYVRLTGATAGTFEGNITHTSGEATQVDKAVTGTVTDPVPMINVTGTLNAFSTVVGTPSTSQSYTLSGAFLTDNIIVTPPSGYALSTDNNAFSASLSLAPTFNDLVYVRLTGAAAGTYDGNITHTSTGATQVDKAVTGTVTEPLGPTTFVEENFIYTLGTALTTNGWTAHNSGGTNAILVTEPGLMYPSYPPVLGYAATLTTSGEDINKTFEPVASEGSVYASLLVNVTSAQTTGDYFFHLGTSPNNPQFYRGRVFIQKDTESDNFRFGISNAGGVATAISTSYDYSYGNTYLVVVKYSIVPGTNNDAVYMWINPVISGSEPTPQLTSTDPITSEPAHIGSLALRQGTAANAPALKVDGIRVTNDWALLWSGDVPPTPVLSVTGEPAYLYSIQGLPSDEPAEYQLSGTDLLGPITVTAPTHFEVSSTGADDWASQIQVADDFNGTIYVRLNSSVVGEQSGDVVNSSPGAENVTLRVEGEVQAPYVLWNITANLQPFAAEFEQPSDIQSYTLSATNTTADISIAVTGPFEISSVSASGPWATNGSVGPTFNGTIYVRMLSTEAGTFNGLIAHTTTNASPYELPVTGTVAAEPGIYASDLFFSEYLEGGSNNKALEIFNGTGVAVDLSDYRFENWYNGLLTPNFVTLTGTLAHNEVYVLAHTLANATITALADTTNTNVNFNGDDALVLRKISTDAIIDIFGRMGEDPGTEWTADGGYSTLNKTLVRKPTVIQGVTVNPDLGFPTLGTEWDVYPIDTTDYLGAHVFTPGMEIAAAPEILPAGGIKTSPVNVTMSTTTPGATIYYTIDGGVPSDASLNYSTTGSFSVSTSTVVKAITYAPGFAPSAVTEVEYIYFTPVSTIAALRAMPTGGGTFYLLTTEAVLTFQQTTRHQKYIQDATAAIVIDDAAGVITTTYNLYDGITGIAGTLNLYNGLLQFTPVVNTEPATSTGNVIVPEVRTLASLTTDDQAKLIKVMNATVDATNINFGSLAENINVTDPTATLVMRTFPSTDYSGTAIPTAAHNITCLVGQYNATMQISPRFLADFEASGGTLMPPDPVISQAAGMITVSWAAVDGATNYEVYGSDNPYSGFTLLDTVGVTSYSTAALNMKFFYVRAIN